MKLIEQEIISLKGHHATMWELVEQQVIKAYEALEKFDKNLANQILSREKMVNAQELVVDHHAENFIALFNPVAVDLRFVISLLKINNNLERIGDFAESIALFVLNSQSGVLDKDLMAKLEFKRMCQTTLEMLQTARVALAREDSELAGKVLAMDGEVDRINAASLNVLSDYIVAHPEKTREILGLVGVIRRVERVGDRSANIAEDIVFYVDAKELRHGGKK